MRCAIKSKCSNGKKKSSIAKSRNWSTNKRNWTNSSRRSNPATRTRTDRAPFVSRQHRAPFASRQHRARFVSRRHLARLVSRQPPAQLVSRHNRRGDNRRLKRAERDRKRRSKVSAESGSRSTFESPVFPEFRIRSVRTAPDPNETNLL